MRFICLQSPWEPAPRPGLPGMRLFAIGDIHGHVEHLEALLDFLAAPVAAARAEGESVHLVLVGDYVDRGPSSFGVLDRLVMLHEEWGAALHLLRGNHDRLLCMFVERSPADAVLFHAWRRKGGDTVLKEAGLAAGASVDSIAAGLREQLGPMRRAVLRGLLDGWRCGEWLFAHAGIDPVTPVEEQISSRWLTMREPFLGGTGWSHDLIVVHGHTIRGPEVLPHRVAIDSGVYRTGVLTAVEIGGSRLRFRCVSDREDALAELARLPSAGQGRIFEQTDQDEE